MLNDTHRRQGMVVANYFSYLGKRAFITLAAALVPQNALLTGSQKAVAAECSTLLRRASIHAFSETRVFIQ